MNLADLSAELIAGHPDTLAYDADDAIAAGQLNEVNRTRNKTSLSGNDLFTSMDSDEFAALTDAKKQMWVAWCSVDRDPTNLANVAFVNYIFDPASATLGNLAAIRTENVSRAVEIGFGKIEPGHVQEARR